jgi:hypothetical protein
MVAGRIPGLPGFLLSFIGMETTIALMKTRSQIFARLFVLIGLFGLVAPAAQASMTLINVEFNFGPNPALPWKVGFAATGLKTNDFWNYYAQNASGSGVLTDLKFADGRPAGAGVAITNAAGGQGDDAPDPMYRSYLYANGPNKIISLTVTNLGAGKHDFYLYGHGNQDNQNSVFELSVGGASLGERATTNGAAWKSPVWQEGVQYVKFPDVAVAAGQAVAIQVKPGAGNVAAISGMQIACERGYEMPALGGMLFWGMLAAGVVVVLTIVSLLLSKSRRPAGEPAS